VDRAFELQVLADLADLRRRVERLEGKNGGPGGEGGEGHSGGTTTKQIVADLEVALAGKISERNMAGAIAQRTQYSERHIRRLRRGK